MPTTNTLEKCGKTKNKEETKMRKIIVSMDNCQKCEMLKAQCPDAEVIKAEPSELLQFARLVGIQNMPFLVVTGEPQELLKTLKQGDIKC